MEKLVFKSYNDLIEDVKTSIPNLHAHSFDLIVGIPRSGMIPAYVISAFLNADCTDLENFIANRPIQRGITRKTRKPVNFPSEATSVLLVDDSIYSGESLRLAVSKIPEAYRKNLKTLVVYGSGPGIKSVDICIQELNGRKLFEWGIFHNKLIPKTCIDMDGVLCEDCTIDDNDDGENYLKFIRNANPLYKPTEKVYAIVSNRLEKYREETERWLSINGIEYGKLVLLDLPNKAERVKIDAGTDHKGFYFKNASESELFIESSFNQSLSISRVSGKPVYCVDRSLFIEPTMADQLLNNHKGLLKTKYLRAKHLIKSLLVNRNNYAKH